MSVIRYGGYIIRTAITTNRRRIIKKETCSFNNRLRNLNVCFSRDVRYVRPLSSSSIPDFGDTKSSYGSKSNLELLKAFFVYRLFSFASIVESSEKVS